METGYSIKGLCPSCFPVNFAKLFGAVVSQNTSQGLLQNIKQINTSNS